MPLLSKHKIVGRIIILLLASLPILFIAIYIWRFGVNIPFMDQWDELYLWIHRQRGPLVMIDLLIQHNEHRPFLPRLIWLTLAAFTSYNVNAELWVNFFIALGTFLFFIKQAMQTWNRAGVKWSPLLIPLFSLLVFNLGQYESWLQGIQTIMFLGMACVVIGLFLLADHSQNSNFAAAILLGVVANFSMVNGLLYWPIGLGVLIISTPQKIRSLKLSIWLLCGAACMTLFLVGWASNETDFRYVFTHLKDGFIFILNFLGAPIIALQKFSWIFGVISLGLIMFITYHVITTRTWKVAAPYLGIILFVLCSALLITVGRMELGLIQSRVSRYQTMSVWLWACLLTFLPLLNVKRFYRNLFYVTVTAALFNLMYTGYLNGQLGIYQRTQPAYQALTSGQDVGDDALLLLHPQVDDVVRPGLNFLCENRLSVCAHIP
jgi:hypothetical protein